MRIQNKIEELYSKYGTHNPIDLADHLKIEIRYVPFLSNPDGQFINVVGKPIVLINQKLKESPERYFVIAHELYHAVEHSDLAGYYVSNDKFRGKLEREANKFAATLILRYHIDNVGNSPYSLEKFRKVYGVCEDMADYLISQIKN